MANHTVNENGQIIQAVGAPNSLARAMSERPSSWWREGPYTNEELIKTFVETRPPTNFLPWWKDVIDGEPDHYDPAWYLGEFAGMHYYAHWTNKIPRYVLVTLFEEELAPDRATRKMEE